MTEDKRVVLNEEELEGISGGVKVRAAGGGRGTNSQGKEDAKEIHYCKKCGCDREFKVFSGTRSVCSVCSSPFSF